jgi:hypothetical protein
MYGCKETGILHPMYTFIVNVMSKYFLMKEEIIGYDWKQNNLYKELKISGC